MGRKKRNTVYRYFKLHEDGTSTCSVPECRKTFKTHHGANLLKHLKRIHKEKYKKVVDLNSSQEVNTAIDLRNCTNSEIVLRECTNLVAVHGRPFSLINDTAFQNLISLIPNNGATVNAQTIKENIKLTASKMRDELVNALQRKILSLNIDITFHTTRSFMGINCQYIEDGHIILQNLGIIEYFQRYSSEHLMELLINNLHRFGIDTEHNKQIYNITINNRTNMIKMRKVVNESGLKNYDTSGDKQIDPNFCNTCEFDLDMEYNIELEETENIIDELSDVLRVRFQNHLKKPESGIGFVRWAVHTFQLVIQDAINDATIRNIISDCKEVVRRLRTPQFVRIMRENEKKLPKFNFGTSWLSKVDMLESLLSLKEICAMDAHLNLPDSTWDILEDFLKSVTPVKYLTKKLQDELLTVGDFYIEWMMCIFKLTKINTMLSSNLIAKMKEREKTLFENDVFLNAIFLDPRVNSILTLDQRKQAKENLTNLYIRYFLKGYFGHEYKQEVTSTSVPTIYEISEARGELDFFLHKSYINRHDEMMKQRSDTYADTLDNLQQSMTLFLAEPLLKSTENVLLYWEKARVRFPFLYRLSSIVLAAPITQVSVERQFSSVKFVLSNYRLSMKDDVIEDLLFIRNNSVFSKKEV